MVGRNDHPIQILVDKWIPGTNVPLNHFPNIARDSDLRVCCLIISSPEWPSCDSIRTLDVSSSGSKQNPLSYFLNHLHPIKLFVHSLEMEITPLSLVTSS